MSEVKKKRARRSTGAPKHHKCGSAASYALQRRNSNGSDGAARRPSYLRAAHIVIGFALACYLGYVQASHVKQLHENELWFSHITVSYTRTCLCYSIYSNLLHMRRNIEFEVNQWKNCIFSCNLYRLSQNSFVAACYKQFTRCLHQHSHWSERSPSGLKQDYITHTTNSWWRHLPCWTVRMYDS